MESSLRVKQSWIIKQCTSPAHILALIGFAAITLMSLREDTIGTILSLFIFLIVTTFSQLKQLFLVAIIAAALSALFPPLAGILSIIAIIMFFIKLKFLFMNWRAVLAGLFVYIYPFFINHLYNEGSYSSYYIYILTSVMLFQIIMTVLYYYGYSSSGALSIMGMLPLMILIFLIPSVMAELQGTLNSFDNFSSYSSNYAVNPNTHWVNGHYRHTPSGGTTYVDPHIRTNPDGIESNNISFKK